MTEDVCRGKFCPLKTLDPWGHSLDQVLDPSLDPPTHHTHTHTHTHTHIHKHFVSSKGRAVQTARSLEEGLDLVIPLENTEIAFEHHNGKLVHITGALRTDKVVSSKVALSFLFCILVHRSTCPWFLEEQLEWPNIYFKM